MSVSFIAEWMVYATSFLTDPDSRLALFPYAGCQNLTPFQKSVYAMLQYL